MPLDPDADIQSVRVILPRPQIVKINAVTLGLQGPPGAQGPPGVDGTNFSFNGSTASVSLVAGSNITLSQNASTISIIGESGGGAGSAFTLNGTSDSVSLVAGANITINSGASSMTLVGPSAVAATNFSLNASSSSVSLVAGANITLNSNASTISIVGPTVPVATNFSLNASSSSVSLVAGANITFNSGANSITIVGPSGVAAATQSLSAAGTSVTGTAVSLDIEAGNNITLATATAAGRLSVSIGGVAASANVVSAIGTAAATSTGTIIFAAGANITLNTGANSITIVGPTAVAATNFSLNATSSSVSLSAGAGIGIGQAASTITISASVQTSSHSLTMLGNTVGSSSGTFANVLNISGAGIVSVGAGAGSITISAPSPAASANVVSAFGTGAATSTGTIVLAAGANITLNTGANSITIVGPSPGAGGNVSMTALGNTISSSSGTFTNLLNLSGAGGVSVGAGAQSLTISGPSQTTLVAGANISLTSGGSSITIIGIPAPVNMTQNVDLGLVGGTIVSKAGTITGTAGVGSSLFLERIRIPGNMTLTEIDAAMSIGFPVTSQGAGTMSRSMVVYSFGNSTLLASVMSASGTSAWATGTSTAGASSSLTQFQGGWSSPMIQPFTFAASSLSPGDYVVGQIFNFAQASSTWTLAIYGAQAVSTTMVSAATNLTSATLAAMSSAGLSSFGSSIRFISAAIATGTGLTIGASAAAGALSGMSTVATISLVTNFSTGSYHTASGSFGAVTNVALGALNSSTLAQLGFPNFGCIGTGSTTSGFPNYFSNGIMSTGAVPAAITLTSTAVTYSGSLAFQQPWFALLGQ